MPKETNKKIMHAISITQLCKRFKGKKGQSKLAVDKLCLDIKQGEVFGFLGPNGAGKSTTIKILLGLIKADSGSARINGIHCTEVSARTSVGYLPEHPTFYDYLTAEEFIHFTGKVYKMDKKKLKEQTETVLHRLNLWEVRKKQIRLYSKGMVQRVGIAQVLVHDPEIYILDEPMSGLDPLGRALVKEIILELKEAGKCVFLSSHIIADVEQICDRIGIIAQGKLLAVETVADVMLKGIVGYSVHLALADGTTKKQEIAKDQLTDFFAQIQGQAETIRLIEPIRKDLEHHFLDLISQEKG